MIAGSGDWPDERAAGRINLMPKPAFKALKARSCSMLYRPFSIGTHMQLLVWPSYIHKSASHTATEHIHLHYAEPSTGIMARQLSKPQSQLSVHGLI